MDEINVQIKFTFEASGDFPAFVDALYIPYSQYQALTLADITAMKQARYDNWKTVLTTPPLNP